MIALRIAKPSDAEGILDIYAPHVRASFCTFESDVPSVTEIGDRIVKCIASRPWLVAAVNNTIASYAYASAHRERTAYQWSCECSVYTHPDFQGTGIGLQLYQILFQLLKMQGYRNVYAGITLPNIASIRLHEKCGFRHFSTYENVGFKLGQWKSVGWWKLQINEYDHEPSPPLKFIEIEPAVFENLFVTASAQILQRMIY